MSDIVGDQLFEEWRVYEKLLIHDYMYHRAFFARLLAALDGITGPFDLVLASFSLHHLADPADKLQTLQRAGRLLTAHGFFALIDVFCAEAEPRERYLERWIANADRRYRALLPAERILLFDHVRARDFPLSLDAWRTFGTQAGLPCVALLLEDRGGLNRLVTFSDRGH
jgi:hypothetical protein